MSELSADLSRVMVRELETLRREIELFPDEEGVWRTVPGITNPAGTLALHVCGNLKHFVGAVLGRTGYVRDRDAEFATRGLPREVLLAEIAGAIEVVRSVLPRLEPGVLAAPYPAPPPLAGGATIPGGRFLLHVATHLAYHVGQAGYLRRVLTGASTGAGGLSVAALAEPQRAD